MREFFGIGGYAREAEGFLSWQHLLFVTCLMVIMVAAATALGLRNRDRSTAEKNRVLMKAAVLLDAIEIFRVAMVCIISDNPMHWLMELPLYLCSIQLIALPLAAFSRGRVREAAVDFVCIFGMLGALLGTYGAGNNYGAYPVISFDNVVSGITHSISGFASLYIMIARMAGMRQKNMPVTFAILLGFCAAALAANICFDCNYMFLMRGDGTPYEILFSLVGGNPVLYGIGVVALFLVYILLFYAVYHHIRRRKSQKEK